MKDIYELLNDIDIKEDAIVTVSEFEKERTKKFLKKNISLKSNKSNKKIIAAALILCSIISLSFSQDALAQGIKMLGELFQKTYASNSNFEEYSNIIDKTISQDGIDLTFNSAVISNDTMVLDFTVRNNNDKITEDNLHEAVLIPTNLKINDENVPTGAGAKYKQIDDNTIRVVKSVDIGSHDFVAKGILNIEVIIDNLFGERDDFNFKFKYDKTDQDKKSVSQKINKTLELNNNIINIDSISLTPLTSTINFRNDHENSDSTVGFIAIDNNNNFLKADGIHSSGSISKGSLSTNSKFLSNVAMKNVTFIPYELNSNADNNLTCNNIFKDINLNNKESFVLNITNDFGVVIKDLIIDNNHFIVKYNHIIFNQETCNSDFITTPLVIKEDDTKISMNEYDDEYDTLFDKYITDDCNLAIFRVSNADNISIGLDFNYNLDFFKDNSITLDLPE